MKRRICCWIIFFVMFFANCGIAENHKVLLYVLGCDLESESGAATDDIIEIMHSTERNDSSVFAYMGGCGNWQYSAFKDNHCYNIQISNGKVDILAEYCDKVSATKDELAQFLKTYGNNDDDLIFWGHGYPDNLAIGYDELNADDCLTIIELQQALIESGLHFRLIGFDACNMAALEVLLPLIPYADLFVASTEKESLKGWSYNAFFSYLKEISADITRETKDMTYRILPIDSSKKSLTVINVKEFQTVVPYLIRVLNVSSATCLPLDIIQIASECIDNEAGMKILRFLNEQSLMITGSLTIDDFYSRELIESYQSFIGRK